MAARTPFPAARSTGGKQGVSEAPGRTPSPPFHFPDGVGALYDDSHVAACHERWMLRHELPDAYQRWTTAPPDKAPSLAFKAVAGDPDLLLRLNRTTAKALGMQAQ